jgi:hypothetical protein
MRERNQSLPRRVGSIWLAHLKAQGRHGTQIVPGSMGGFGSKVPVALVIGGAGGAVTGGAVTGGLAGVGADGVPPLPTELLLDDELLLLFDNELVFVFVSLLDTSTLTSGDTETPPPPPADAPFSVGGTGVGRRQSPSCRADGVTGLAWVCWLGVHTGLASFIAFASSAVGGRQIPSCIADGVAGDG